MITVTLHNWLGTRWTRGIRTPGLSLPHKSTLTPFRQDMSDIAHACMPTSSQVRTLHLAEMKGVGTQ